MFIEKKNDREKMIENENKPFKSKDWLKYMV